jgi:hypothetical protein
MGIYVATEGSNLIGIFEDKNTMKVKVTEYVFSYLKYHEKIKNKDIDSFKEEHKDKLLELYDSGIFWDEETCFNVIKLINDMIVREGSYFKVQSNKIYDFTKGTIKKESRKIITRSPVSPFLEDKKERITYNQNVSYKKYKDIENKLFVIKDIKLKEKVLNEIPMKKIFLNKDIVIPERIELLVI